MNQKVCHQCGREATHGIDYSDSHPRPTLYSCIDHVGVLTIKIMKRLGSHGNMRVGRLEDAEWEADWSKLNGELRKLGDND